MLNVTSLTLFLVYAFLVCSLYLINIKLIVNVMKTPLRLPRLILFFSLCLLINACDFDSSGNSTDNSSSSTESKNASEQKKKAPPPAATVAQVIYEEITEWDEYTGRLSAPENVELRARVSGYIEQVHFKEGSLVEEGDLLFTIDRAPFQAEVSRNKALLDEAKSNESNARSEFERAQRLIGKKAIAQELFEARKTQFAASKAQFSAAKATLEIAELDLNHTQVRAPISGRISRAMSTKGNFIAAGQNMLTTIVSTDRVFANFETDERAYLKYSQLALQGARPSAREAKTPVLMALANDTEFTYQGYIDFIDNQVNLATSTIQGRAVFENENQNLIPGLFARIRVPGSAQYSAVLIDDKAIATNLNNKLVLVLDENNALQIRPVSLGNKFAGLRVIKSGLQEGETILINGLQKFRPGTKVTPNKQAMASDEVIKQIEKLQAQSNRPSNSSTLADREIIKNSKGD